MIRKKIKLAGIAAALTVAFSSPTLAATEITWWHAMGGSLGDVVNEISKQFNASQSDYSITPVFKGTYEETLTAGIAAFRGGGQPNILQVYDAGAATLIGAKGAVIAVEDLLKDNGVAFDKNDYISGVRNFYGDASGKMVGMPFNSSTPLLYFNQDALDKAGVEAPKTWEEFEAIAPKIKDAGYVPLAQSHLPWIFTENFFSRHNLPFATNQNGYGEGTPKLLINTPEIKAHFTAVKKWYDGGWMGWYGAGWGDNAKQFEDGKVAMWLGSSGSFGGLSKTASFPFSATYLPYWEGIVKEPTTTFIGGAALWAMSGKADAENKAVAEFFKFLTSAEVQYMWHKETGYVPITTAAYEMATKDGYYESTPAAEIGIKQLMLDGGENSKGYRLGFYTQVRDVMNREYARIINGDTSVDDGFSMIEKESNKLLERFAKTMSK